MTDVFTEEKRSWVMRRIRSQDTKPEIALRSMLHRCGYRFRVHKKELPGKPDIVLPRYRAVILVHGCFWHAHRCQRGRLPKSNTDYWSEKIEKNRKRDRRNLRQLRKLGWRPIVVWECALKRDAGKVLDKVIRALEEKAA